MTDQNVVTREDWLAARRNLLAKEKAATRLRDEINAARMALPWVRVDEDYVFATPTGPATLSDLFDGRSQLVVYHFMLGPGWAAGCPGCSFLSDHFDATLPHLNHHDVTLTAVSRAPLPEIDAYKQRMGWRFPWASSHESRFNYDYGVSFDAEQRAKGSVVYNYQDEPVVTEFEEMPGLSTFAKDERGTVYHTYSSYARGLEEMIGTLMVLDRAPKGRNEGSTMDFVRRHDEYDAPAPAPCHGAAE